MNDAAHLVSHTWGTIVYIQIRRDAYLAREVPKTLFVRPTAVDEPHVPRECLVKYSRDQPSVNDPIMST